MTDGELAIVRCGVVGTLGSTASSCLSVLEGVKAAWEKRAGWRKDGVRGVRWDFCEARVMALTFFLPVWFRYLNRTRGWRRAVRPYLVVEVLCPPFRNQLLLQLSVLQ